MAQQLRYILEQWTHNSGFVHRALRPITRENAKYLISDVQRTVRSYDKEPREYVHVYKWATKFVKDPKSPLGFRRSVGRNHNTDGTIEHKLTTDPSTLKCEYSFEEVFGQDLRILQDPTDEPLSSKDHMFNYKKNGKYIFRPNHINVEDFFKITMYDYTYDRTLCEFLKDIFKVDKIYHLPDGNTVNEHKKQTILSKTATLFQITHFTHGKKVATFNEDRNNTTITYWLFDDRLVFQYDSGKKTW